MNPLAMYGDQCEECNRVSKELALVWMAVSDAKSELETGISVPGPEYTLQQIKSQRASAEKRLAHALECRDRALQAKKDHEASTGHLVPKFTVDETPGSQSSAPPEVHRP